MAVNNTKTKQAVSQAKRLIPGLTQLLSKRPDMFSPEHWPTYFSKAKGVEVWDLDGNKYIDVSISGIGANILGYAFDAVDDRVVENVRAGISSSLNCYEDVQLAEKLITLHPWADKVKYARCGGEAMSVAVRIARAATKKEKIAFCGYHGWQDWYLATNVEDTNNLNQHLIGGLDAVGVPQSLAGTTVPFPFNDLPAFNQLIEQHGDELAAIVMEPMRSMEAPECYWRHIEQVAHELNIPLIIDEISMGFRVCAGGSHLKLGINPDIAVFSKAIANGYAMSAIVGKQKWMDKSQDTFISSTMWTERVGPTAALASIEYFERNQVADHLVKVGELVKQGWQDCAKKHEFLINISGIPALCHFSIDDVDFTYFKSAFVEQMLKRGFLASNMFYAMYSHKVQHIQAYIEAVDESFAVIKEMIKTGTLERDVVPVTTGFKRLN